MFAAVSSTKSVQSYNAKSGTQYPGSAPQSEDSSSFNDLVLAHQDAVFQKAYWMLGDEDAAADAVQETFLRAFRSYQHYNGGPFRPWILQIAAHYCIDQIRKGKAHQNISIEVVDEYGEELDPPGWLQDSSASVEETVIQSEERERVMECIYNLPSAYRNPIILVDLQELDYSQAAGTLGLPLGTFKSRLNRARIQLQKYLSAQQSAAPLAC